MREPLSTLTDLSVELFAELTRYFLACRLDTDVRLRRREHAAKLAQSTPFRRLGRHALTRDASAPHRYISLLLSTVPYPRAAVNVGGQGRAQKQLDGLSQSVQDIYVKQYNSQELGLTKTPKLEQAMAWLIEHGPVHLNPSLPAWMLHDLVEGKRIANLRRGVYLAPTTSGEMWSLPAVATHLEPSGYLSFYGALILHGLTDQDTALWGFVQGERQGSLRYGQQRLDFVPWRRRVRTAETKRLRHGDEVIRVATPAQAFIDSLEAPRYVTSWPELLHVLRTGIALGRLAPAKLRARAIDTKSPAIARRLGLLLELETGKADPGLLALAQRSNNWTRLAGLGSRVAARDPRWRVELPRSREDLLAAVRD